MHRRLTRSGSALAAVALASMAAAVAAADPPTPSSAKELASICALLDDPVKRALMDALELRLLVLCGRTHELGRIRSELAETHEAPRTRAPGTDVIVNDPSGEVGSSQTQSETSVAIDETTGIFCSGYNDSYSGGQGFGYTGYSRSTNGGATFDDRGALSSASLGDPSIVWRRLDGSFYFATLHSGGLGIWRSSDDCQTFQFLGLGHADLGDDKELLAVDNNPASAHYGRLYMVFTNFSINGIQATYSDDGTVWAAASTLSAPGSTQGPWPTVAPDGTVYVGWARWTPYFTGPLDIEITKSTDGGVSFVPVTNPMTGKVNPYESAATNTFCGRPALHGRVRYLPSPQLAASPNGDLHVVYSYDPDGRDLGDVVNVYYRRSTDQGTTWQPEVQLNDDGTMLDQFFPTVSAGPTGRIVTTWYDRRADSTNTRVEYYARVSEDGGVTWPASERVSDVSSPIYLDPGLATCYHGDYDQQLQSAEAAFIQWADDRTVRSGHNDPDTYFDRDQFGPDFTITAQQLGQSVCLPAATAYDLAVTSISGFTDPVTLSASGNPAGTAASFSVNPVVPTGASRLTIAATDASEPGTYPVDITGIAGERSHTTQVSLTLSDEAPGSVMLISPADGALGQPLSPVFSWAPSAQAETYHIEIARDPAFQVIVDSASVPTTSYATPVDLAPETIYYWHVHADNACGEGRNSRFSKFKTVRVICQSPGVSIPDADPAGIDLTLITGTTGTLVDLNLSLQVAHGFVGDLAFRLTHVETGTSATLFDRPIAGTGGCSGHDVDAVLDDEATRAVDQECGAGVPAIDGMFTPTNLLASFDGEDLSGTWILNASDNAAENVGIVGTWCLQPAVDAAPDSDGDGLADDEDNCTILANTDQHDTDDDGIGNFCDGDFDQSCVVNFGDVGIMKQDFFAMGDLVTDMNADGATNFTDLGLLKAGFFAPPGPSGVPNLCSP